MKKITFLMLHLNYGGIEKQVTTLANELSKEYEVAIISLYDILSGESFYQLDDKVKVKYIFNFGPNKDKIKELKARVLRLEGLLEKKNQPLSELQRVILSAVSA